jgi:Glycosyltransferase family 87
MTPTGKTWIAIVLWIAALAAAASLYGKLPSTADGYRDFAPYYVQSLATRKGIDPYQGNFETVYTEAGRPFGDLDMGTNHLCDTPIWILLFEPLTFLSPKTAYWTWQALNTLALAGALFLLIRELGLTGAHGWAAAALMSLYPPISLSILFGRGEMILLLLFVLALIAMKRHRNPALGITLGIAALLRAYPFGMLGYLVARRNWKASAYMVGACVLGGALTLAVLGTGPITSFGGMTTLLPGKPALGQPMGLLKHPANLNLGWFVRFVVEHSIGARSWASGAGLVVELMVAVLSFAAVWVQPDDRYVCGYSLWIALVTLLSPVSWPSFLACLVPLYVGVAAAAKEGAASRGVVYAAGASYLAAFFMGGPTVGFIADGLHHLLAGHVHIWHMVPETIFTSLALAYVSALLMTVSGTSRAFCHIADGPAGPQFTARRSAQLH